MRNIITFLLGVLTGGSIFTPAAPFWLFVVCVLMTIAWLWFLEPGRTTDYNPETKMEEWEDRK